MSRNRFVWGRTRLPFVTRRAPGVRVALSTRGSKGRELARRPCFQSNFARRCARECSTRCAWTLQTCLPLNVSTVLLVIPWMAVTQKPLRTTSATRAARFLRLAARLARRSRMTCRARSFSRRSSGALDSNARSNPAGRCGAIVREQAASRPPDSNACSDSGALDSNVRLNSALEESGGLGQPRDLL